jgi:parallel beta-helix repeat protein
MVNTPNILGEMESSDGFDNLDSSESMIRTLNSFSSLLSHDPINITGNSELITHVDANNWKGTGAEADPFIINGLNISTDSIAIIIRNTDLFFQISNCLLNGDNIGIKLENVSNCLIINNTILEFRMFGIVNDVGSKNNGIRDNVILSKSSLQNLGIVIKDSFAISVFNNTIDGTYRAIQVKNSEDSWISYNSIYNNSYGIHSELHSDITTIFRNQIRYNDVGMIIESSNNEIVANYVEDNKEIAILLNFSSSNKISSNSISYNSRNGIILNQSADNQIYSNIFLNNGDPGLLIVDSANNIIRWNDFGDSQAVVNGVIAIFDHNYWSEASRHADQDGDGIVDWTMNIPGTASCRDVSALKNKHRIHLLELNPINENLSKTVTVSWKTAYDSYDHSISYSLYLLKSNSYKWELVEGELTTTEYDWDTTSISLANGCRMKVVADCPYKLHLEDLTDIAFSITNELTKPTILYPNGGEIFDVNAIEVLIRWDEAIDSHNHPISYSISYTDDNGTKWNVIAAGVSSDQYEWNITAINGGLYMIKVNAECSEGLITNDITDQVFTIQRYPFSTNNNAGFQDTFSIVVVIFIPILVLSEISKRKKR